MSTKFYRKRFTSGDNCCKCCISAGTLNICIRNIDTSLSVSPAEMSGLVASVIIADKETCFKHTLARPRPFNKSACKDTNYLLTTTTKTLSLN